MKSLFCILALLAFASSAIAGGTYTKGYLKRDGTYVAGHAKTSPDTRFDNNYSSQGNINPYSGKKGSRSYESYAIEKSSRHKR